MRSNKIDKTTIFLLSLILILVIIFSYRSYLRKTIEKENLIYTIGVVRKFDYGFKGTNGLYYEFKNTEGKTFKTRHSIVSDTLANKKTSFFRRNYYGKYFLVEFSTKYSWYHKLLLNKPVPDSLYNCTNCYWEKPPW